MMSGVNYVIYGYASARTPFVIHRNAQPMLTDIFTLFQILVNTG